MYTNTPPRRSHGQNANSGAQICLKSGSLKNSSRCSRIHRISVYMLARLKNRRIAEVTLKVENAAACVVSAWYRRRWTLRYPRRMDITVRFKEEKNGNSSGKLIKSKNSSFFRAGTVHSWSMKDFRFPAAAARAPREFDDAIPCLLLISIVLRPRYFQPSLCAICCFRSCARWSLKCLVIVFSRSQPKWKFLARCGSWRVCVHMCSKIDRDPFIHRPP